MEEDQKTVVLEGDFGELLHEPVEIALRFLIDFVIVEQVQEVFQSDHSELELGFALLDHIQQLFEAHEVLQYEVGDPTVLLHLFFLGENDPQNFLLFDLLSEALKDEALDLSACFVVLELKSIQGSGIHRQFVLTQLYLERLPLGVAGQFGLVLRDQKPYLLELF